MIVQEDGEAFNIMLVQGEDSLQQLWDLVTVSSHQLGAIPAIAERSRGKVGVGQDDLVAVSHEGEGVQQVGGQQRRDAFQYHLK